MTPKEQLEQWVNGNPIHNEERGECCPDFSCCKPELLQPLSVREAFQDAFLKNDGSYMSFLNVFLEAAMELYRNENPDEFRNNEYQVKVIHD